MHNTTLSRIPFFSLIGNLRDEIKRLIREEIKLAKTEMSEKFGILGKNAAFLAIGGLVAYGGVLILLTGLGGLIAYFFARGGMNPLMAIALGLLIIGVLIVGLGGAFVMKALGVFKEESLAPEKTIDAIKHNTDKNPAKERVEPKEIELKRSPDEIKSEIDTTQDLMKAHARELKHRLTPAYMGKAFATGVRHHPVRASLIGAASGLVGFFVVKHQRNHNHNGHHPKRLKR
ncbi:MAG TPA: phage holin family protein [Verrucomicrobiae bacterium]|nr:phage holin family protein [Verrucomicrobiae bacterium]